MGSSCCLPTCRPASDGERVCLGQEGGIEEKEGMYCNKLLVSLRYTYIYYAFSPILLYYLYCTIYGSHVRSRASSGSPPSASALRLFFSLLLFLSFPSSSSLLLLFFFSSLLLHFIFSRSFLPRIVFCFSSFLLLLLSSRSIAIPTHAAAIEHTPQSTVTTRPASSPCYWLSSGLYLAIADSVGGFSINREAVTRFLQSWQAWKSWRSTAR